MEKLWQAGLPLDQEGQKSARRALDFVERVLTDAGKIEQYGTQLGQMAARIGNLPG